ncbi:MAG: hypothetical protein GC155_10555 [Alphaproteobacteria bacterium]|nr:hypothetical protein [Alphaproteobacteria bacterium]
MFGGPLFDIVLVVFFVFLTMSAVVSAVQELVIQGLRWRSRSLRAAIHQMLGGDSYYKDDIAKRFYRHPLIAALGGARGRLTHIEPDTFVTAMATAVQPAWSTQDPVSALPASVAALKDGELKHRLMLILPPPDATPGDAAQYRDLIKVSIIAWFDQSIRKLGERYKADATALSYCIAAGLTVLFNVSPIEIAQRLSTDNSLRTSFASVVPELSNSLFNSGQGIPVAQPQVINQNDNASPPPNALAALSSVDVQTMLSIYQCTRNRINLPLGWPWMADMVESLSQSDLGQFVKPPSDQQTCDIAIDRASKDPELSSRMKQLGGGVAPTAGQLDKSHRKFGPSFKTDNPGLILLGWLLSTFAAAQGAPFWFDALRRVLRR